MEETQVPPQGACSVDICLLARERSCVFVDCDAAQRPDVHGNTSTQPSAPGTRPGATSKHRAEWRRVSSPALQLSLEPRNAEACRGRSNKASRCETTAPQQAMHADNRAMTCRWMAMTTGWRWHDDAMAKSGLQHCGAVWGVVSRGVVWCGGVAFGADMCLAGLQ